MFFCNPCARERRWPKSMFRSYGRCEVCGEQRECSDVPSKMLPLPSPNKQPVASEEEGQR